MSPAETFNGAVSTDSGDAPRVAWPLQISEEKVLKWVRRRMPRVRQVRGSLYHHPMLGVAFQWDRPFAEPMLAHAIVDLVGGRAYAAEHWDDVDFVSIHSVEVSPYLRPPTRAVSDETARTTAQRLISSVLLRRRKLGFAGRLAEYGHPLLFGKPNWWVQGSYDNRDVEVVVDGLTGNHYVFKA